MGANFLIEHDDSVSTHELVDTLQARLQNYGTVSTLQTIVSRSFSRVIEQYAWYMMAFLLLTVIAVFARTVLKLQTKHAGIFSYGFSAVLLLLILVVSIVFGFRQSRRQAEIEVLRSGD